jgi:hypothetical protein
MMILAIAALTLASGVAVQTEPDDRPVIRITVYGNDRCPQSSSERIVVCARRPESERYRIPQRLRDDPDQSESSWAEDAEALETIGRTGPQSCSTVGPGGFTGCWEEMVRQARRERQQQRERNRPR